MSEMNYSCLPNPFSPNVQKYVGSPGAGLLRLGGWEFERSDLAPRPQVNVQGKQHGDSVLSGGTGIQDPGLTALQPHHPSSRQHPLVWSVR